MRLMTVLAALSLPLSAVAQEVWPIAEAPASFLGTGDWCGGSRVASIGDLDNDGTVDFAVGAPLDDTEWPDSGRVFLFSGDGEFHRNASLEDADVVIGGAAPTDMLGWDVSGIGDINGDGFDDLAVGVLLDREENSSGTVRIFFGPWQGWGDYVDMEDADVMIRGEHLVAGTGTRTINAGDVDGDGLDDLWIGSPYSKLDWLDAGAMEVEELKIGRVHLVLGRTFWPAEMDLIDDSHIYFTGDAEGGLMGSTIAAGDISGDGVPDMCVGSPGAVVDFMEGVGQVHCFTGLHTMAPGEHPPGSARFIIVGPAENTRAGTSLAFEDFNGDGILDIIVGAPYSDESANAGGSVTGYVGGNSLPMSTPPWGSSLLYVRGEEENGCFGYEIAAIGDVGEDGYGDLIIGAPGTDGDDQASGRVYLLTGRSPAMPFPTSTDDIPIRVQGEFEMDRIGTHLSNLGDIGWGYPVFMIGSSHTDHGGIEAGKSFLLHSGMTLDDDGDGYTEVEGDCRDDDPDSYPGADEDTGVDDDCDGWTEDDGDCDDTCANCFPDAPEIADGLDNDCDGEVDEVDLTTTDSDGDGWTLEDGDCDDGDVAVYPGATEVCNGLDDNCNGVLDDAEGGCDEDEGDDDDSEGDDDDVSDDDSAEPTDDGCECSASGRSSAGPVILILGAFYLLRRR